MIIKILAIAFALYALSRVYSRFRRGKSTVKEIFIWTFIWIGIIAVVIAPNKTNPIAHILGMGRGFDALVFLSMLAVFYTLYKILIRVKQIESDISSLVSEISFLSEKSLNNSSDDKF